MMGIITMQIVSTEHLIALSPWSIKRYDRKVSAGKIVDCLFVDAHVVVILKMASVKETTGHFCAA